MSLYKIIAGLIFFSVVVSPAYAEVQNNRFEVLKVGKTLPNARLSQHGQPDVQLDQLKGRVKIISIVPKLNTPVCDKQTHKLSEENGGLDQRLDIITISTNSTQVQSEFSEKTNIRNIRFLSDSPDYDFGGRTGLIYPGMKFLMRTVMVVDENNIIRYVDFVPGGGMPAIDKALKAAEDVLNPS